MASTVTVRTDEEIARRKHDLLDLHSEGNYFPPICRLPPETLQAIFIHCAREWYGRNGGYVSLTVPSWVNVSFVCRRWRHVALNCSTLWCYLFITSPRWTEELLERSKQASLKVSTDFRWDRQDLAVSCVLQVMKHAERIQELHLCLSRCDKSHKTIISTLSSCAPRLINLSISAAGDLAVLAWPSVLFGGDTPVLQTLELVNCPLQWYLLKLGGVTTLVLRRIPHRFQQNTADFLATLGCMRNLTILRLEDVLSSATDFLSSPAFETFRKISLASLVHLEITAPVSMVIVFLRCVQIPLKTTVDLTCNSEPHFSLIDYAPLSSLLAQRFDTFDEQAPTPRSFLIGLMAGNVCLLFNTLERQCYFDLPFSGGWDAAVPLRVTIHFNEIRNDVLCFIADICCSIPLENVRSLCVMESPTSSTFWRRTLGHLQDLRHLELMYGRMPDLASLLSLSDDNHTENQGRGLKWVCAPALQALMLRNITFKPSRPAGGNLPHRADVQLLYDALSGREGSRGRLIMDDCLVAKSGVQWNVVGRWDNGHFRVVEKSSQPCDNLGLDSDSDTDSENYSDTEEEECSDTEEDCSDAEEGCSDAEEGCSDADSEDD